MIFGYFVCRKTAFFKNRRYKNILGINFYYDIEFRDRLM